MSPYRDARQKKYLQVCILSFLNHHHAVAEGKELKFFFRGTSWPACCAAQAMQGMPDLIVVFVLGRTNNFWVGMDFPGWYLFRPRFLDE